MSTKDTGGSAFPVIYWSYPEPGGPLRTMHEGGMTLRQHAAIKLRVPDSGTPWLDEMISAARRDDFAAEAMHGICAHPDTWGLATAGIATASYEIADAMIKARQP